MAFLVYFFVLLVMVSGVLFGLDWVKAPLHEPEAQQRTHVAMQASRSKSERPQKPPVAYAPIGRTQPAGSAEPEPVVQQQPAASAPVTPPDNAPVTPADEKRAATAAPSAPNRAASETTGAAAAAETQRAGAERKVRERKPSDDTASRRDHARVRAARRHREREEAARAPAWAVQGAEAARREAEQQRHGRVPAWAIEGAEAARRDAENVQAQPVFRPFWTRDEGWHMR